MSRAVNIAKFTGLVTLIGLIDVFDSAKRGLPRALPILALLALVMLCNQLGVEIAPGYMAPLQFDAISLLPLVLLPLLVIAPFSFGWLASLYAFITVFCFVLYTSSLPYDHAAVRVTMVAALATFMLPALFIQRDKGFSISDRAMEQILVIAALIAFAVIGFDASYGFRFAGFTESMQARGDIVRPAALNYASDMLTCSVLPFAVAWGLERGRLYVAIVAGIAMIAFFPMLLSKVVLFGPIWVVVTYALFRFVEPKLAACIGLATPLIATALLYRFTGNYMPFFIVDIRMIMTPSIAIDRYAAFFADHPHTYFCQINLVRAIAGCPYTEQLGVIMKGVYDEGNFNASFLATEGIASVGILLAPIATFACGLVIAAGNIASSRLFPALIAASSGVFLNVLMNVPLSVAMVSNGGALLFLLFFLTRGRL
jgi:hypothetical protein